MKDAVDLGSDLIGEVFCQILHRFQNSTTPFQPFTQRLILSF